MADHVTAGEVFEIVKDWGLLTEKEWYFLFGLACHVPKECVMVELGTFRGMATAALCLADHERVLTVDNYSMQHHGESSFEIARANLSGLDFHPLFWVADSHVVPNYITKPFVGLLFIDTDHRDVILKREIDAWLPFLAHDAVIAMHDYTPRYPTMMPFIDSYFRNWRKIGLENWLIAFERQT